MWQKSLFGWTFPKQPHLSSHTQGHRRRRFGLKTGKRHRLRWFFNLLPVALSVGALTSVGIGRPKSIVIVGAPPVLDDSVVKVPVALVPFAALLPVLSDADLELGILGKLSNRVADQVVRAVGFGLDEHERRVALVPLGLADAKPFGTVVRSEGNVGVSHHGIPLPGSELVGAVGCGWDDAKHPVATADGLVAIDALDALFSPCLDLLCIWGKLALVSKYRKHITAGFLPSTIIHFTKQVSHAPKTKQLQYCSSYE